MQHGPVCWRMQVAMETREVTRMANRIRAAHRWAVTGTPLGPSCLGDLFGLLQVRLGCEPCSQGHCAVARTWCDAGFVLAPSNDLLSRSAYHMLLAALIAMWAMSLLGSS
jgi:SNF2-related domain